MCQSTVYRNLMKPQRKLTKGLMQLCNYLDIEPKRYLINNPCTNTYLMRVLSTVWNGSDEHARQIGKLLLAAHSCKLTQ